MDTKLTYKQELERQLKEWDVQTNLFLERTERVRTTAKRRAFQDLDKLQDSPPQVAEIVPKPDAPSGDNRQKKKITAFRHSRLSFTALTLAVLTATGCAVNAPEESLKADDVELALASEVAEELRAEGFNNIAASANFNPTTGQLVVAGQLPQKASVRVESGSSNQLLGIAEAVSPFADNNASDTTVAAAGVAPWQLVLTAQQLAALQLTTVPCTLRLLTPQGTVLVPVQSIVSTGQSLICDGGITGQAQAQAEALTVTRSTWSAQTGSLIVAGSGAGPRQAVTFLNASTGQVIGIDEANAAGEFRLRLTGVANPPCEIQVVTDSREVIADVTGAPAACGVPGGVIGSTNLAPNTVITIPSTESIVTLGTTVLFDAIGIDPDNNIPLTYNWNFGGAGPDSSLRSPTMKFDRGGVYRVTATVTDALGATDLTPDVRTIIVQAAGTGVIGQIGSALAPNGQILLPAANTTVSVGQGINFSAVGSSVSGLALTYVWNFGGAAANVAVQNPGPVIFTKPGVYTISMTAVDALGYSDVTPDTRVISVIAGPATGATLPPNGEITAPVSDLITAQVGQSIVFSATGADPDGNLPITYLWDFGGAAPPSAMQTTSLVFSQPGNYRVTLYVFDSLGAVDPTPAIRNVVVQGTGQTNPGSLAPNGTILSPVQDVSINVGQSVIFAGTGSDPSAGSSLIFTWNFDGGAQDTTVQNPGAVMFNRVGTYRVRMTARNNLGLVDPTPAERIITVTDPLQSSNVPSGQILSPVSDSTIQVGQSINFAATATDLDGIVGMTYEWDFGFAAPVTLTRVQNPGLVVFNQPGTYRVSLRVRDPSGLVDPTPEFRVINVLGSGVANQAPDSIISSPATDLTVYKGGSINFIGAGSDPEGSALTYRWLSVGVAIPNPTQSNAGLVTFNQVGTYWVSLVATDSLGLADPVPEVRTITVRDLSNTTSELNGQITSPAAGNVTSITAGQFVTFSATSSNANGSALLSYVWDFDGGAASSTLQNPGNISFFQPGTYRVTLRVMDDRGGFDSTPDLRIITVRPTGVLSQIAPEGIINSPVGDVQIGLGQTLNFAASGTDADNNIPLSFRWNFDGAAPASTAQNAGSVTFTSAGVYNVLLTVTDSTGLSDPVPAVRRITVLGSGSPLDTGNSTPVAIMVSPAVNQTIQAGQSVSFQGSGINPTGNEALNYMWTFGGSGLPSSSLQSPGLLTFSVPGTYTVTLNVSNGLGVVDPTPETRLITVVGQGTSVIPGGAPDGMILTPATNQIISVGDTVHFMGHVMSSTAGQTVRNVWNFFGGAPSLTELSPGDVTFNTPGVFQVMFTVQDAQGLSDPTPAMRTITVNTK